MKQWNVRINDVVIGPISDESITVLRASLVESSTFKEPLRIEGPSALDGKRIEAYWTPGCSLFFEEV